ncbi:NUDIX hydrolase [Neisseria leonii]|uniref:GDP-mannose pyrophosphatase n=1 Tax=Neisseria leonii TaxID=2995413 RepID=A0A9X4E135_9NEIS|nr:NUDIX hydrolase [Neisseria sp. 51.81]MDD9327562.1 NUDIX hydrolase [Neisseria sp. 51.81]
MDLTETLIDSEPVFDGSFLSISHDRVRLPDGGEGRRIVVRHPGAACVLAVTDDNRAVLVRQWRHPAGGALLELPAGKLGAGEDPAQCALRELAEETPYTAGRVSLIAVFYTAPGFCDEKMYLYRAHGVRGDSGLSPDADEFVETVLLDRKQVRVALSDGRIQDAKTIIGLQNWLLETEGAV